jgi:hypothetical protein
VATFEHAHGRQKADAGTETGTANFELAGEFTFRGKAITRMNFAAADERANVLHDLHGELTVAGDLVVLLFNLFFHAE